MKYRDAKKLKQGDLILGLFVVSIDVFAQYKTVVIHCKTEDGKLVSFYNAEVNFKF